MGDFVRLVDKPNDGEAAIHVEFPDLIHEGCLTWSPISSNVEMREGDTGPKIETPEDVAPLDEVSLGAGSAVIEWGGASNVAPKRRLRPQPVDWRCPNCQVWVARYWTHCDECNHPRVG